MIKKNALLLIGILSAISQITYAHSPNAIKTNYDSSNRTLKIVVTHPVNKIHRHFIKKIEILDDEEIIEDKKFKVQSNKIKHIARFVLPNIKSDRKITIKAYCNIHGELSKEIRIE